LRLFLAGLVPGLLLTALFLGTVLLMCLRKPTPEPPGPATPMREKIASLSGVVETLLLFVLVIGGLYVGWFKPTEAGAAGAAGALLLGVVRGKLSLASIVQASAGTLRIWAMVVLLITGAVLFGRFLTVPRLPFELADWAAS